MTGTGPCGKLSLLPHKGERNAWTRPRHSVRIRPVLTRGGSARGTAASTARRSDATACKTCDKPFAATKGTPYYRPHKEAWLMTATLILRAHGCPPQAIVAAFWLDERTVRAWLQRAGAQCTRLHGHLIEAGPVAGGQVQADEIRVKVRSGVGWPAMARDVASRLWLGGVVGRARDGALVTRLLERVRACIATHAILLCVDGFAAYIGAARAVFRAPVYNGKRGRSRLVWPEGFLLAQVVKSHQGRRLAEVMRRVVVGTEDAVARAITATRGGNDYQHRLHRALPRGDPGHLPRASGTPGTVGTRDRARDSSGRERNVARRLCL